MSKYKPRIKWIRQRKGALWFCDSPDSFGGFGQTPLEAYEQWRANLITTQVAI